MSSPHEPGNRGGIGDDLVSKMGSMSDADLDALLAGSAAKHTGSDDPFADIAKKMSDAASGAASQTDTASADASAPTPGHGTPLGALTGDGALDISFSDYQPPTPDPGLFGKDEPEPEPIDPTTVVDHGVQSSVQDRPSSVDPATLSPDYSGEDFDGPSLDDLPEIDENGDPVLPEDTRFAPRRPSIPDADVDAAPAEQGTGFHAGTAPGDGEVDFSQRWREEQDDFAGSEYAEHGGHDDYGEDSEGPKGPGIVTKAKDWYMGLPVYLRVALPLGLVVALILAVTLTGGDDAPSQSGAPTGGGQIVNNDPVVPGDEVTDGTDLLTANIETVSARCGDGSASATHAFSTDPSVAWVCQRVHGIDGSVLNIVFRQPVTLTEIRLTPGFDYVRQPSGDDEWNRHRVVTKLLWRAGGKQFPQEIVPSRGQAVLTFDEPVVTESMSLTIQESVPPSESAGDATETDPFAESFGDDTSGSGDDVLDATAIQNIEIYGSVR